MTRRVNFIRRKLQWSNASTGIIMTSHSNVDLTIAQNSAAVLSQVLKVVATSTNNYVTTAKSK